MIGLSWEEVNGLVLKARETERERIIQVLLNNTSEINLMLNGEVIRLDAWDKTPKFAEQTLRQLFEGENK